MISKKVHDELMSMRRVLHYLPVSPSIEYGWTPQERQAFWLALDRYPRGPWTAIAEFIGTKSTRQAMTHGQKLRQKLKRWGTRLHRNPAARSLMDGVTTISTSTVSAAEISAAVSIPRPQALVELSQRGASLAGMKSVSPRPRMRQDESAVCLVVEDKDERLRQENESSTANSSIDSVAMQGEGKRASLITQGGLVDTSSQLEMLFDQAAAPSRPAGAAMPIDLGETKHDNAGATLYPICDAPVPARNLLDELADALWSDHTWESKESSN
ncbi:hypothetical protein PRNP1_001429 [Phytophthora ramorum]